MAITKLSTNGIYGDKYGDIAANNNNWYEAIQTTVLSSSAASVTFSDIPQDYKHLQIRGLARSDRASVATSVLYIRVNGDTGSNYSTHYLLGYGNGSAYSGGAANQNIFFNADAVTGSTATSGMFGASVVDLLDYADTSKFKTARVLGGFDINQSGGGNGYVGLYSGNWRNTNAITSITIFTIGNFIANTRFSLYGLRA